MSARSHTGSVSLSRYIARRIPTAAAARPIVSLPCFEIGARLEPWSRDATEPFGSHTEDIMNLRHSYTHSRVWLTFGAGAALLLATTVGAQQSQPQQPVQKAQTDTKQTAATEVDLDALEEQPSKYLGQRITVRGEVQNVLGPRLFTVDEQNWVDFDGETLVLVQAPAIAFVREDRPVMITGIVRPFVKAEIMREWGWLGDDPEIEAQFDRQPILVAESVTSVGDAIVLTTHMGRREPGASASAGQPERSAKQQAITDIRQLATTTDERLVGRQVNVQNAQVDATTATGFWVDAGEDRLFVLPAGDPHDPQTKDAEIKQGDRVNIMGTVLGLPTRMKNRLDENGAAMDEEIYVYASQILPAR